MIEVVVAIVPETKNIYYLSPNSIDLKIDDKIIFDSENGLMNGVIIKETFKEKKKNLVLPLYNVLRLVNDKDNKIIKKNSNIIKKSLEDAKKYSKKLNLDMKFVDSYLNFD